VGWLNSEAGAEVPLVLRKRVKEEDRWSRVGTAHCPFFVGGLIIDSNKV
jgi:hypothetical protein